MRITSFKRCLLAAAVSSGTLPSAFAVSFNIGEIQGQFDSTLSIGASWATANPDKDLIDVTNGGRGYSSSGDDGRLNFKKGETFSKIFKGVHDLELNYGDTRAFVRGKYWYDFELKDENRPFKQISDDGRTMSTRSSGAEFLDAFIAQRYEIAGRPGDVRLGKQVVSWGESLFIGNSINAINPLDVVALLRPGSEIKEGLIPVNMLYVSQGLTDSLSLEGFYQLQWKPYALPNCGTFFGADPVPKGCNNNLNAGLAEVAPLEPIAAAAGLGFGFEDPRIGNEGVIIPRLKDHEPRDGGQYGMALRWLGDSTEYGAYYINYHSRKPKFSLLTATGVSDFIQNDPTFAALSPQEQMALGIATGAGNTHYFIDYPENIHLFGLSFATQLPTGTAWSGEISYRPNEPLSINTADLAGGALNPTFRALTGSDVEPTVPAEEGQVLQGWKRKEVTQAQTTFLHVFDPLLGADSMSLAAEFGVTHIGGLESLDKQRYGRDSVFGDVVQGGRHGYYTQTSWGYRAYSALKYTNVFAGINLTPNLGWSHDVDGYGPTFNEGSKAVSLGLDADYRNTYTASLSYTNYFGGDFNTDIDRDYVSLSLGVNF
ncbi:DUF1302 domain-containing protein [Pseudomonas sp. PSE14]|uniref:DUF1302 domain-containing protein n=1 Tax=Pseudomonas sp. PSE14 TaxID=3016341 RepID=UPI0023D89712|nr:DUF1302 domain-containing protein [Pseudomonas sp. PSE14]WEJ74730.1 DUF1302 domain-containing protein [Pseudomonas sp. PSE14]